MMNNTTKDGLTIYDLDPNAAELWVVAGPAGYDVSKIDTDNLPDGFRWVENEEWEALQNDSEVKSYASKNYEITVADGTETVNGHECYAGQLILTQPQGTEIFDTFDELVDAHPICEEARGTFE
jgi:hypothetical protein